MKGRRLYDHDTPKGVLPENIILPSQIKDPKVKGDFKNFEISEKTKAHLKKINYNYLFPI